MNTALSDLHTTVTPDTGLAGSHTPPELILVLHRIQLPAPYSQLMQGVQLDVHSHTYEDSYIIHGKTIFSTDDNMSYILTTVSGQLGDFERQYVELHPFETKAMVNHFVTTMNENNHK